MGADCMEADRALRRLLALRPRDLASITSREFYDAVIRCFVELCGIRHGAFYVVSTRGGRLELKASFGLSEEWQTFSRELTIGAGPGCGTSGWAAAEKRLVISRDHSESSWDGLRQHALSAGLRSSWAIPLFDSDREVIGVFTGYDTAPGEPAAHQIQQAEHIIHEAATIIEMATLYYGQKGLLKLHRRTQELAQQLVLRATPEAVFEAIAGAVKELLAADLVWMQYVTTDGRVQFFQSEEFFEVPPLSFPGSPCRIALETNQVLEVHRGMDQWDGFLEATGLSSVVSHPLYLEDGQAVISAGWQHEHHIIDRERLSIDLYTKFGGIALQNAVRYATLRSSYYAMMRAFLTALEVRDFETIAHSRRVVTYAMLLAEKFGFNGNTLEQIALGAALHDVGKIAIPDRILHKAGKLTPEEFEVVRSHPVIGYRMLESSFSQFPIALDLVRHHHERYDGKGYPDGLAGEAISREARILSVADAFDVMTTDRPYKKAKSIEESLEEVASLAGSQFCPAAADALLALDVDLLEAVRRGEVDCSPFPVLFAAQPETTEGHPAAMWP